MEQTIVTIHSINNVIQTPCTNILLTHQQRYLSAPNLGRRYLMRYKHSPESLTLRHSSFALLICSVEAGVSDRDAFPKKVTLRHPCHIGETNTTVLHASLVMQLPHVLAIYGRILFLSAHW